MLLRTGTETLDRPVWKVVDRRADDPCDVMIEVANASCVSELDTVLTFEVLKYRVYCDIYEDSPELLTGVPVKVLSSIEESMLEINSWLTKLEVEGTTGELLPPGSVAIDTLEPDTELMVVL